MRAYVVFTREKTLDQGELDVYAKEAETTVAGHGVKMLASQCPDYVHQIVDFADNGGSARTQVVFHTESGKKGQDQFRKGVRIPLWALDLSILGDELALVCFCFE